jgi:cobalamin-dependent methionine synthase I
MRPLPVAKEQVEGGAQILDMNMDEGLIDGVKAMTSVSSPHRQRTGYC